MPKRILKINGYGMSDQDGDLIFISIETEHAAFRFECPADKATALQDAFISAIKQGTRDAEERQTQITVCDVLEGDS